MNDAAIMFALFSLAVLGWLIAGMLVADNHNLRKALAQASKNDNRDAKGRYARAPS